MASYIKTTDFAVKDGLLTGNPLKIVSGTELNDEFNAIQTATNSKGNINSPTFTGVPKAPTAAPANNTTQIASTAFVTTALVNYQSVVDAALQAIYPIGSVYTNTTNATNPATIVGFGTWVAFGVGRVLVGVDSGDTAFDTLGEVGGTKDSTLAAHTHTTGDHTLTVAEIPSHNHDIAMYQACAASTGYYNGPQSSCNPYVLDHSSHIRSTGGDSPHNHGATGSTTSTTTNGNLQPYVTVHMWTRTA